MINLLVAATIEYMPTLLSNWFCVWPPGVLQPTRHTHSDSEFGQKCQDVGRGLGSMQPNTGGTHRRDL